MPPWLEEQGWRCEAQVLLGSATANHSVTTPPLKSARTCSPRPKASNGEKPNILSIFERARSPPPAPRAVSPRAGTQQSMKHLAIQLQNIHR